MAKRTLPSQDILNQLLSYNPATGKMVWLERGPEFISDLRARRSWNGRYAGKEAFCESLAAGYRSGTIFAIRYPAHRVIWKLMTGVDPIEVDHINGNGFDNRWRNLRNVDHAENGKNTKRHKNNSVGVSGVHRLSSGNYHVRIVKDGKRVSIGTFTSVEDAAEARRMADQSAGYHTNHGR